MLLFQKEKKKFVKMVKLSNKKKTYHLDKNLVMTHFLGKKKPQIIITNIWILRTLIYSF